MNSSIPFKSIFLATGLSLATIHAQPAPSPGANLNKAIGIDLITNKSLWEDDVSAVAQRLKLPPESTTTHEKSFRTYPDSSSKLFGARPYSIALYGTDGKPTRLSIMYLNRGDYGNLGDLYNMLAKESTKGKERSTLEKQLKDTLAAFPPAFKQEEATLIKNLTIAFGPAKPYRAGSSNSVMKERGLRWDSADHAILLSVVDTQYISLKIIPSKTVDAPVNKVSDTALKERLRSLVQKRPCGDVVITDIPMVNQGPKGYCVPATMERMLRFVGIPADMYILALAAGSSGATGTNVDSMMNAVSRYIELQGRRLQPFQANFKVSYLAPVINNGIPLLWAMNSSDAFNKATSDQTKQRETAIQNPAQWKEVLKKLKKEAHKADRSGDRKAEKAGSTGHVCMIIGYNPITDEIAISDSWGPDFAERWITVDQALAVSQGPMFLINW